MQFTLMKLFLCPVNHIRANLDKTWKHEQMIALLSRQPTPPCPLLCYSGYNIRNKNQCHSKKISYCHYVALGDSLTLTSVKGSKHKRLKGFPILITLTNNDRWKQHTPTLTNNDRWKQHTPTLTNNDRWRQHTPTLTNKDRWKQHTPTLTDKDRWKQHTPTLTNNDRWNCLLIFQLLCPVWEFVVECLAFGIKLQH